MKIRIKGNSVRLRLTQTEVANFLRDGGIEDMTQFPGGKTFSYKLSYSDNHSVIHAEMSNALISIILPEKAADVWASTDQVSLENDIHLENGGQLKVLVEKDFQCLKPRAGEDESDNFPNPLEF